MGVRVRSADAGDRSDNMSAWERLYYGAVALVLIVGSAILAGCASIEGDGFSNGGTPIGKLCHQKTRYGERWYRC